MIPAGSNYVSHEIYPVAVCRIRNQIWRDFFENCDKFSLWRRRLFL